MAFTPHGVVFCVTSLTLACAACLPATRREFLDGGGSGLVVFVFVFQTPGDLQTGCFFFCTVKKDGCARILRGQLSMNNGSGSTMMLEIRCQLVYLMPGVQGAVRARGNRMEPDPMGFCDDLFPQESSWDSSYLFTAMSQILIEEVMGYHTTTNHEAGGVQLKADLSRGKT